MQRFFRQPAIGRINFPLVSRGEFDRMKHCLESFPCGGKWGCVSGAAKWGLTGLICLLAAGLAGQGSAAQVDWLYDAEVEVAGQDAEQRKKGIDEAFLKVLVRVTGNRSVRYSPELVESLRDGDRYLQQYRYQNLPLPSAGDGAARDPRRLLKASFDPAAVDRALRNEGLPVWGANRPAVLVWLGVEENRRRRLALPEQHQSLWRTVREVARERGVPLLSPLLDLEDQSRLQVSDLWGDFESSIRQASERYTPDAVLTGRLASRGRSWRGHWVLYTEQVRTWQSAGETLRAAAAEGMEIAIDHLASKYVPVAGDNVLARMNLRIEDLRDLAAYGRISSHLRSLDGVEHVGLVSVEPTAATFGVEFRGARQSLEQVIALGGLLEPLPGDSEVVEPLPMPGTTGLEADLPRVTTLEYRLRP